MRREKGKRAGMMRYCCQLFTLGTLLHATTLSLSLHLRYLKQVTKSHNVLFTQFYIFMCITLFDCGVTVNWYVLMGL